MKSLYLSWDAPSFAVFERWDPAPDVSNNIDEIDPLIAYNVPQGVYQLIRAFVPEVRGVRVAGEKLPKASDNLSPDLKA